MNKYTFAGKWENSEYEFTLEHVVYAFDEQTACELAFRWFMGYHKNNIPFKMNYVGMRLVRFNDMEV